mmetsp:Transcript_789/g.2549  ORF Transcript_789/g.2549 Transcript_789/m.2549 type:complete len:340 (-) Transcript_789:877-1896(-)|eukprot:CAMPEP_0198736660 /NCGR_PEP_ID=MMETSP1475-20131203/67326_1 /TAXON_ID= ORGANISM="Unidentified sp., Strain CCMP1999" /NCGR_SAMPLE_ID=MMETSP1475 /ASSEMBLY_ACC=CAM_ASM_001111 /LENGTH=339 /DNA_ID=CAMNT_0044500507 /DNA_START=136 /DNA_END=1155 /DNA_ORIENTATION=-
MFRGGLRRYMLITAAVGGGIGGWFYVTFKRREEAVPLSGWEETFYRSLPLRALSRGIGAMMTTPVPSPLRPPVYRAFCSSLGCDPEEAEKQLTEYKSVAEFFRRGLREDARPISPEGLLVCPCDGEVMSCGSVSANGFIHQIKGVSFPVRELVCAEDDEPLTSSAVNVGEGKAGRVQASDRILFYVNIYLAAGDYHRFHSPTTWTVKRRRHVPGDLLSVRPGVLQRVPDLFTRNERVILLGRWPYGFISMVAVGATNVGNITIEFDDRLATNKTYDVLGRVKERRFATKESKGIELSRGAPTGAFNLGSSIVVLFEAPADFKLQVAPGDRVRFGQQLGS